MAGLAHNQACCGAERRATGNTGTGGGRAPLRHRRGDGRVRGAVPKQCPALTASVGARSVTRALALDSSSSAPAALTTAAKRSVFSSLSVTMGCWAITCAQVVCKAHVSRPWCAQRGGCRPPGCRAIPTRKKDPGWGQCSTVLRRAPAPQRRLKYALVLAANSGVGAGAIRAVLAADAPPSKPAMCGGTGGAWASHVLRALSTLPVAAAMLLTFQRTWATSASPIRIANFFMAVRVWMSECVLR
jgi:hypothetical protein